MNVDEFFAHPTAVIDHGSSIGPGTRIWHFSHICAGALIGARVILGQNVFVSGKAVIGDGCKIQNNVSVYDNVCLSQDVFCGPSVVFTNVLNPRAFVDRRHHYADTMICKGATLGANSTIVCGATVGEYAFVGAGAVVTQDVKPFALVVGVPARQVGWISRFGDQIPLPLAGSGEYYCENLKFRYELSGAELNEIAL